MAKIIKDYSDMYKHILDEQGYNNNSFLIPYRYPVDIFSIADKMENIKFVIESEDEYAELKNRLYQTRQNYEDITIDSKGSITIHLSRTRIENVNLDMMEYGDYVYLKYKLSVGIVIHYFLKSFFNDSFFISPKHNPNLKSIHIKSPLYEHYISYNACKLQYPNWTMFNKHAEYECLPHC